MATCMYFENHEVNAMFYVCKYVGVTRPNICEKMARNFAQLIFAKIKSQHFREKKLLKTIFIKKGCAYLKTNVYLLFGAYVCILIEKSQHRS
jgi:hypothetical protein